MVTDAEVLMTVPCGLVHWKVVFGMGAALKERIWPAQTGLLLAITGSGGNVPMAKLALAVALPQALVTVSESVGLPGALKQMEPGDAEDEEEGVPPGKFHA